MSDDRFDTWLRALEARHLAELSFPEVSRALRALSSAYVEQRARLQEGAALSGAGKRAAFALFYGPLHFLIIQRIVAELGVGAARPGGPGGVPQAPEARTFGSARGTLVDLGCGTGAAGAAWASGLAAPPDMLGVDRHPWAVEEAVRTYRHFGLKSRSRREDVAAAAWPKPPAAFLAAFTLNELAAGPRDNVLQRLLDRAVRGDAVLVVEPLAKAVAPWWDRWARAFEQNGGRRDEWRFSVDLPPLVAKLDRAAGLNHRELTARSMSKGLS